MESILSKIQYIQKQRERGKDLSRRSVPHNARAEFDELSRLVHLSAEVHPDCLDKGEDLSPNFVNWLAIQGAPGDRAVQIIDKRLGGLPIRVNFAPISEKLDISAWKEAEEAVYNHVKKDDNRYARLFFAFTYDNERDLIDRPVMIYYYFELYKNGEALDEKFEGELENPGNERREKVWVEID